jgi:hypothetical protein
MSAFFHRAGQHKVPSYAAIADLVRVLAILGWLTPHFLASAFACQSLFDSLLLPGLEVKGVFLGLFYDVFLQNLALKTPQSVFNGFTRVNLNLSHLIPFYNSLNHP